jgi:SAM-dependent methyltransferase
MNKDFKIQQFTNNSNGTILNKDNVYIHSLPENANFYDLMWKYQRSDDNMDGWGNNRILKLLKFFGTNKLPLNNKSTFLDMCCGLGRFSIAALELGFDCVVACDGSYIGPKYINDMVYSGNIPQNQLGEDSHKNTASFTDKNTFKEKLFPIQVDIEKITECFKTESFNMIIHHMALHHTRDYKKTLTDLSKLLSKNGILVFNFFIEGTTPDVTYDLRKVFLNEDMMVVKKFLIDIKKIITNDNKDKEFDFNRFLSDSKYYSEYHKYKDELRNLSKIHNPELIYERLRWEDIQTPYLHNLNSYDVFNYVTSDLGMKILNYDFDRVCAIKA